MKNQDRKRLFIVGIFVFIGLIIMLTAIFMLGGKESRFAKHVTVNTIFENIEGLKTGNNVWLSGMKIGTVKNIHFIQGNKIQLILKIEEEFREYVKKDGVAKIGTDGLIGNKIVVIEGGTDEAEKVEDNDYLSTASSKDMSAMIDMLQKNGENLTEITANLVKITDDINQEKGLVGLLIKNPALASDVKAMVAQSKNAVSGLNATSEHLRLLSRQMTDPRHSISQMANDTILYNDLITSAKHIRMVSENLTSASEDIRTTSSKLKSEKSAFGILVNNDTSGKRVEETVENLKESSETLKFNIESMKFSPLFKKGIKRMEKEKSR